MSLDTNTIDYLEDLLENYFRNGWAFTSLDIANIAKNNGYFVRNRWIAEWLRSNAIRIAHDMGALFNQILITVDSKVEGDTLAYLYYHKNMDPDSYLNRDQNPISAPRKPSAIGAAKAAAATAGLFDNSPYGKFNTTDGGTHAATPVPSSAVVEQHKTAVDDKIGVKSSSAQYQNVQRDVYGRFTSNPNAFVTKPTHFQKQKRDVYGRYLK